MAGTIRRWIMTPGADAWRHAGVALGVAIVVGWFLVQGPPFAGSRRHLTSVFASAVAGGFVGWSTSIFVPARRTLPGVLPILAAAGVGLAAALAGRALLHLPWSWSLASGGAAIAFAIGGIVGAHRRPGPRTLLPLLALVALASCAAFDADQLRFAPFRDLGLYLRAAEDFLAGRAAYQTVPPPKVPADLSQLPYVYPPFTLPMFALLAPLPAWLAICLFTAGSAAAAVAALRSLGVSWTWVPVIVLWPPLFQGLVVGNVAVLGFSLLMAGFRAGWAIPLSATFKAQAGIPILWLVRERRWRALVGGLVVLAILALVTLPFTGIGAWRTWLLALDAFQRYAAAFPSTLGLALVRRFGVLPELGVTVIAVGIALLARGRDGLARFGVAAIVASPTLYVHGFLPSLPAVVSLNSAWLWLVIGIGFWGGGPGPLAGLGPWIALAIALLGLLVPGMRRRHPGDAPWHPLGAASEPWPEAVPGSSGTS